MVYSDLNQNPLIIPLEILGGHKSSNGGGENYNLNHLLLREIDESERRINCNANVNANTKFGEQKSLKIIT